MAVTMQITHLMQFDSTFRQKFLAEILTDLLLYYIGLPHGTMVSAFPAAGTVQVYCANPSNLLPELTQGEKMSQILKEQTDQLKIKVIKSSVSISILH